MAKTSMLESRWFVFLATLFFAFCYWSTMTMLEADTEPQQQPSVDVVVAEPVQVLLYFGDRFLAANIENIRASAFAVEGGTPDYVLRARKVVSHLNPCHEDNYWIGNVSLTWGGSVSQGFDLLRNASQCRYWDEWPPFFYGFNQNFFYLDIPEARMALEIAATRSSNNAAVFRTYAAMLETDRLANTRRAITMLKGERDQSTDEKLKKMLDVRILRLNGLLILQDAQAEFEKKFAKPLQDIQQLIDYGVLNSIPEDPMKIGYEFRDKAFHLGQMKFG